MIVAGGAARADCVLPAAPLAWSIGPVIRGVNYSKGIPASPEPAQPGLFAFDFPPGPGEVHYVTAPVSADLRGRTLRLRFEIVGDGEFVAAETPEVSARLRLHFQRSGDDWTGRDAFADYRWWSRGYVELRAGAHEIEAPIRLSEWSSVLGRGSEAGFEAASANVGVIGFTFGGMFAGHGVSLRAGRARLRVTAFTCD